MQAQMMLQRLLQPQPLAAQMQRRHLSGSPVTRPGAPGFPQLLRQTSVHKVDESSVWMEGRSEIYASLNAGPACGVW